MAADLRKSRTRALLLAQFDIAWALAWYHLEGLTNEECLWEPAAPCIHVRRLDDGSWRADWPERETYDIGPPSIAWTTWHISYWWNKAIAHLVGEAPIEAADASWPGDAEKIRMDIQALRNRWRSLIEDFGDDALEEPREDSWPIPNSSPDSIAAWLNVELTKNAAEIGAMRFLYAVGPGSQKPRAHDRSA